MHRATAGTRSVSRGLHAGDLSSECGLAGTQLDGRPEHRLRHGVLWQQRSVPACHCSTCLPSAATVQMTSGSHQIGFSLVKLMLPVTLAMVAPLIFSAAMVSSMPA